MVLTKVRPGESGYTLVETAVALALFITVLLPLTASIVSPFTDRRPEQMNAALCIAEKEMTHISVNRTFADGITEVADGFLVSRSVKRNNVGVVIEVTVSLRVNADKPILVLCKSIVVY